MITGKTLIELGYKPAKWFGAVIKEANEKGLSKDELGFLIEYHSYEPPTLPLHIKPIKYHVNLDRGTTQYEKSNYVAVIRTMNALMKTPTVVSGAVMPDACPTGEVGRIPVGAVVVARNAIHPSMHSADICCSVMATCLIRANPAKVMDVAEKITHFGPGGRPNKLYDIKESFYDIMKSNSFLKDDKSLRLAEWHMGTQGDGNHFLYVGTTKAKYSYLVTHHGSRGLGAYLYRKGMKIAEKFRKQLSPETLPVNAWIPFDTEEGQEYWEALQIVKKWTHLNHYHIHKKICEELGINQVKPIWNTHNFVYRKGDLFYHGKGATPLDGRQAKIIPLNMAEPILMVDGDETETNLGFAPHGAGRNISRTQHEKDILEKTRDINKILANETEGIDARFFSGVPDISELPSAYKNAEDIKNQMKKYGLGKVIFEINPYGCIMAGKYKRIWDTT